MRNPLISIIIATYNRGNLIDKTLDSILLQTYKNWECIIVDDGSVDQTEDVINKYVKKDTRFQYHKRPEEKAKGGNASRNYGFQLSKGDYVNWFDDDDVMLKDFLKTKIEAFSSKVDLVIASHYIVDKNLKNKSRVELKEESYLLKDYLFWKLKFITGSVLFRKKYLFSNQLFNEDLTRGQETELFSRLFFQLSKDRYKILNIPLFLYRQHDKTKSSENLKYIKSYKESQSYTAVEILKKSIELKDNALFISYYKYLINAFFRSLENNHNTNARFISKNLFSIIKGKNKSFGIEFLLISNFFLFLSKGIYKVEKRWKRQKINV
ncbi:glycosyltransferase family 2 protein [Flavivirga abyssicola]|uniref:glycosyltransferase family 2 protein n=1 Tax=Flavivirga abyssicola TaxID=3063533 RepID=UPI0026DFFA8A|nr:glycosyltransferase family 2 protein [Flavivirga sp. MEBiC07777]WVK13644.1 glycosyltransferase family 2 protein [Flavivirga sp. MEBiC07777]